MKKILAYLLVLVSLMTLFCGTAGAEETGAKEIYFTNSDANAYFATVTVTDLSNGKSKDERIYMGYWMVTATCKYEQTKNSIAPLAAWASSVVSGTYNAGGDTRRVGEPSESTRTFYEGLNRYMVEHYYTCSMVMNHASYASKYDSNTSFDKYSYGPKTSVYGGLINTKIQFLRKH